MSELLHPVFSWRCWEECIDYTADTESVSGKMERLFY